LKVKKICSNVTPPHWAINIQKNLSWFIPCSINL
jgi:hypothetical protein